MYRILFLITIISFSFLHGMSDNLVFNNQANNSKFNANVAEDFMHKFFKGSGWTQLPGEIGSNGIDGLYVKMKNGVVSDVLLVESKFKKGGIAPIKNGSMSISKSGIGKTVDGAMQMSKEWCRKKIKNLIKHGDSQFRTAYKQIGRHIENGTIRKKYFGLSPTLDNKVKVVLYDVVDEGVNKVKVTKAKGRPLALHGVEFDPKNPKKPYERKLAKDFNKIKATHEKKFLNTAKAKTVRSLSASVGKKAALKGAAKGLAAGLASKLPFVGIAAQIGWDVYLGYKIEMHDVKIEKNEKNIQLNTDYISRLQQESEVFGIKINKNTYNISALMKDFSVHTSQLEMLDKQITTLTFQVIDMQTDINQNTKDIEAIRNGIFKSGINKLNEYYDTNGTDPKYLNTAIEHFDNRKVISNGRKVPLVAYYLVIARYEQYLIGHKNHDLEEIEKNYTYLADMAGKNPEYMGLLNNAYIAISDLNKEQLKSYKDILADTTNKVIDQKIKTLHFDESLDMAEYYIQIVDTDKSSDIHKKAYKAKIDNFEKNKYFTSVHNALNVVNENQNSLLNEVAARYLYSENSFENTLEVLRTKRFDDNEFRVIIFAAVYAYLGDKKRLEEVKEMVLTNSTYTNELKKMIKGIN